MTRASRVLFAPSRIRRWVLVAVVSVGGSLVSSMAAAEAASQPAARWTTSRVAGIPDPPPPYRVEVAFPQLKFDRPVDLTLAPGSNRLFVAEQAGKLLSFVNAADTKTAELVIDLKPSHPDLTAFYGVTFHPQFAENRYIYLCYVNRNDKPTGSIVSRFEVSKTEPPTIDAATEQVILQWWSGGHNGGCLKFGPDGYLYISTGDGAGPDPPDTLRAGQDVTNLLSAILRIDVDHRDGERNYRVPADNPLLSVPGARPEIWSYGYRNPWRMSFDRVKGDLWVGDVGWQLWEMIYRVERGGNYGWSIMEGPQVVLPGEKRGPTPILPPTVAHPHSEASSITGGFVYHGTRLPELKGVYLYGDFQTGKVWGLRHDGQGVTWRGEIANTPLQLVAFGEDLAGEVYLVDYERSRQIYRLVRNPADSRHAAFPRKLSQTGIFADVAKQQPAPGVFPYAINAPHWADHTTAQHWFALPNGSPIQVDDQGNLQFPNGSVLVKTVSLAMAEGVTASVRKLETQLLHREEDSWRPYTYAWNNEQTDAELLPAEGKTQRWEVRDPRAPGGVRAQDYRFASRAECQLCHNPWVEKKTTIYGVQSASPLALSLRQWNRTAPDAAQENQLASFQRLGLLAGKLPADLAQAPRFVNPYDESAPLAERVKTYLHVNCSHCHQPHAGGTATIDLLYETPWDKAKTLGFKPTQGNFGISSAHLVAPGDPLGSVLLYRISKRGGGRMPRLGSEEVDERAVQMVDQWIRQLPVPTGTAPPRISPAETAALASLGSDQAEVRAEALRQLTATTRGAFHLLRNWPTVAARPEAASHLVSLLAEHPTPEVRDLFERFVPASQRPQRLGNSIRPAELLAIEGNAERGRQLFFREGAAACKNCHRAEGRGETLGPDLTGIGKKYPPAELLGHLLEPSKFIDPKYVAYTLEFKDGRIHSGLLVERTDQQVVLRTAQNEQVQAKTGEIESFTPQAKSLMPELLLRDLTPQQAADLLRFLNTLR